VIATEVAAGIGAVSDTEQAGYEFVGVDPNQTRASGSVEASLVGDRTLWVKHEVVKEGWIRPRTFDDLLQSIHVASFALIVGHVPSYQSTAHKQRPPAHSKCQARARLTKAARETLSVPQEEMPT
jgi:hypothetical protein